MDPDRDIFKVSDTLYVPNSLVTPQTAETNVTRNLQCNLQANQ